jgi:hypothetical protein
MVRHKAKPTLHAANGIWEALPILKEALVELTLDRAPSLWLVAEITDELILGLNMQTHDEFVNLRRHMLRL